jgi:hypothetical protein
MFHGLVEESDKRQGEGCGELVFGIDASIPIQSMDQKTI